MASFDPTTGITDQADGLLDAELDLETIVQIQREEVRASEEADVAALSARPVSRENGAGAREEVEAPTGEPAVRVPPILRPRIVSGRYLGQTGGWRVELRIDIDGVRPTRRISADYFAIAGATVTYFGSMIVESPTVTLRPGVAIVTGVGRYTWSAAAPRVRVTIPRMPLLSASPPATLQHFTHGNVLGATYVCQFVARPFRTVELEQDRVTTVTAPFASYDTGLLPSGGPARMLSVQAAYLEAGVELRIAGVSDVVPPAEYAGTWSNAELHASMERHFSLWRDEPQWKVWLLHADLHDLGPNLLGIMFDQSGRQRQGATSFYRSLAGTTPDKLRSQLYTCVHELGHCFNLFHSFHKQYMQPPLPNRLDALSWMNYPQSYPSGGASAFWASFPFQFDAQEIVHLRHAFRSDIVMGGNPFGVGAALENPAIFADPMVDRSSLRLTIDVAYRRRGAASFALGEPVIITLELGTANGGEQRVNSFINPSMGFVHIGIARPDGRVQLYRPPITHCVADELVSVTAQQPLVDHAYIGFGKDGQYFEQAGTYRLRAIYEAPDGSRVLSNVLTVRVRTPKNATEEEAADLLLGNDQGMLMYLLGSDAPSLREGNDDLDRFLERHKQHPAAPFVRVVKGANLAKQFKTIDPDAGMQVRAPDPAAAIGYLKEVSEQKDVDELTLTGALQHLSTAYEMRGQESDRQVVTDQLLALFKQRTLTPQVLSFVRAHNVRLTGDVDSRERSAKRRPAPSYSWPGSPPAGAH